jgi:Xaa-Pro dipeptidase
MQAVEQARLDALIAAEGKAMVMLSMVEDLELIRPGRTEKQIETDIYALAAEAFGVEKHWHKRIVRAGANTVRLFHENPPDLTVGEDDTVFLDLGPVFDAWEADVGRTYALGQDAEKRRLVDDLPRIFDALKAHADADPEITGAQLYAEAQRQAHEAHWLFGGAIAGHIVGEFPHARIPGEKDHYRISPANPTRLADPDGEGRMRFWILEVHLVDRQRRYGGFYERLMLPPGYGGASHGGGEA